MTEFTIEVAGQLIGVQTIFDSTRDFCRAYLCSGEPDFVVSITPEDIAFEHEKSLQEATLEGLPVRNYSDSYLETIAVQRKIAEKLFDYDTLLFHGSVVAVDGVGYLFTAKSGTGKSTHTRLWREVFGQRAVMVNDDKPFLRVEEDMVLACGTPWNGKHGLGNNMRVPLKAICILERGEENKIQRITPQEALFMLLQQSNRPRNSANMNRYMTLLDGISQRVAFYRMQCNMNPEAARTAFEGMNE